MFSLFAYTTPWIHYNTLTWLYQQFVEDKYERYIYIYLIVLENTRIAIVQLKGHIL